MPSVKFWSNVALRRCPMVTDDDYRELISELNPEMVLWDGLDEAIVGVSEVEGTYRAVYSIDAVLKIFQERDGMTYDDAREWVDYNMAPGTPGGDYPLMLHNIRL